MATGNFAYEGVTIQDSSRAHLGHNLNTLEARNLPGSHIASQNGQQIIYGPQNNYIGSNDRAPQPPPSRRVSVPLATVSTYTDRLDLSQELEEKLGKTHGTGLAHAATVIGLGGTGKTQLVLHYIEKHEAEYDTVLWIDVRTEEAARSSYERCCRVLGLPMETSSEEKLLQDMPYVQAVLTWLRARPDDKKWLTILDNVDDLSWDVSSIVPKGKAGTVIVTSQDSHTSRRLLGGCSPTVKVDAMTSEEAMSLVINHFNEPVCPGSDCWDLLEEITGFLDRLALPMDLAGARISVDAENWGDLDGALRQYLSDYRQNQDKLLQDAEFATTGSYNKTIWTAWETSLCSLRQAENDRSGLYPVALLSFLTLFDRTSVQDQLFRLASLGLGKARRLFKTDVPSWLRDLLVQSDHGKWDDSSYRRTVNSLMRYGLVKPISEPWRGVTMHGLVQQRARQELPHGYWLWHMVFLIAICTGIQDKLDGLEGLRFRRHLVLHLPPNDQLLRDQPHSQSDIQMRRIWERISLIYVDEGRLQEAAQLQCNVLEQTKRTHVENDPRTLRAMSKLARIFHRQGLLEKANDLHSRVIQQREIQLGAKHPVMLKSRHRRAKTMLNEGKLNDAVAEIVAVLDIRREILGDDHDDTLHVKTNLALAYSRQGKLSEAQELQTQILEARKRSLDQYDPDLLASMGNLASTYAKQGEFREAEPLQIEVLERFSIVFGREHYRTLKSMRLLEKTYSGQGKHQEAKELRVESLEASLRVLGPEHLETLKAMKNLTATLIRQGLWKDVEELGVKTLEASSRVRGQNHPYTLDAMQNLALAAKCLGQNDRAIDLMRRAAESSTDVLGHDHPDCKFRHKRVAEWSGIHGDIGGETDHGLHQDTHSS